MATSQNLSDQSVIQSRSLVVAKNRPYSDFDLTMYMSELDSTPNGTASKDIVPLYDIDAVKQSVKNLILTDFNERPFNPRMGSNIRGFLFEPADKFTMVALRKALKRVVEQYEPRVDSVSIYIEDNSDENRYEVTVGFRVITLNIEVDVNLYLVRLR